MGVGSGGGGVTVGTGVGTGGGRGVGPDFGRPTTTAVSSRAAAVPRKAVVRFMGVGMKRARRAFDLNRVRRPEISRLGRSVVRALKPKPHRACARRPNAQVGDSRYAVAESALFLALRRSRDPLHERDIVNSTVTTTLQIDAATEAAESAPVRLCENSTVT